MAASFLQTELHFKHKKAVETKANSLALAQAMVVFRTGRPLPPTLTLALALRLACLNRVEKSLEYGGLALVKESNLIEDLKFEGFFEEATRRLMQRFVA